MHTEARNKSKSCALWGLLYQQAPVNGPLCHMAGPVMRACVNSQFEYIWLWTTVSRAAFANHQWIMELLETVWKPLALWLSSAGAWFSHMKLEPPHNNRAEWVCVGDWLHPRALIITAINAPCSLWWQHQPDHLHTRAILSHPLYLNTELMKARGPLDEKSSA